MVGGGENGNLAGNAKIPHQLQYQTLVLAVVSGRSENRLLYFGIMCLFGIRSIRSLVVPVHTLQRYSSAYNSS